MRDRRLVTFSELLKCWNLPIIKLLYDTVWRSGSIVFMSRDAVDRRLLRRVSGVGWESVIVDCRRNRTSRFWWFQARKL